MPYSRVCPFCNMLSTVTDADIQQSKAFSYTDESNDCFYFFEISAITCPAPACKKVEVFIEKSNDLGEKIHLYQLEPQARIKIFPDYVPESIKQDYEEAKLIAQYSPRASATISRRCLQTMVRDFWSVSGKGSLHEEIKAIRDEIDSEMYNAIMALKSIGNIGAHPERDINLIVDVEPHEAEELVGLIEILIEDWYIVRHKRREKINKIILMGEEKQSERKSGS